MTQAQQIANGLFHGLATLFFGILSLYYLTGYGGPMMLALAAVPLSLALVYLNDARKGLLYPVLGTWGGLYAAIVYGLVCVLCAVYLTNNIEAIRIHRVSLWNYKDLLAGASLTVLVLEYTRRRYFPLFIFNTLLILYAVYGHALPGILQHGGIGWVRIVTMSSLEMSTGIFDRLAQLGLTLIGSFILVLATLRAFGCIDSILLASRHIAMQRPQLLPQAAVVGSFAVAAVSGSGAANVATTGSATIPALIQGGLPRVQAAAVETASSLGGQLMPPLMGIAAFMMAELMGVNYFDVAARGFAPAMVYFLGVSFSVYLLALRYRPSMQIPANTPTVLQKTDWYNIISYAAAVGGLIYMMGVLHKPAMNAAQTMFIILFVALLMARLFRESLRELLARCTKLIETFSITTAELTVLLATLGILTAAFTVTGVPTKVGILVMDMAAINPVLMVLVALLFGILVGMGLPAAPTYIILAVVVTPFMIRAGIEPWVAHFFAFFVAVFGELSPPTSVTAAVAARIADAPFMKTMIAALGLCMPLILLIPAVFTRPEIVLEPGLGQMGALALILTGTMGLTYTLYGQFPGIKLHRSILRGLLVIFALGAVLHPQSNIAVLFAIPVLICIYLSARLARIKTTA